LNLACIFCEVLLAQGSSRGAGLARNREISTLDASVKRLFELVEFYPRLPHPLSDVQGVPVSPCRSTVARDSLPKEPPGTGRSVRGRFGLRRRSDRVREMLSTPICLYSEFGSSLRLGQRGSAPFLWFRRPWRDCERGGLHASLRQVKDFLCLFNSSSATSNIGIGMIIHCLEGSSTEI
jgi:hypothetical protein